MKHYSQIRRYGYILPPERETQKNPEVCQAPECDAKATSKGYCNKHWGQIRNHGKLTPERERKTPYEKNKGRICLAQNCGESAFSKGYCRKHWGQIYKYGRLTPELEKPNKKDRNRILSLRETAIILGIQEVEVNKMAEQGKLSATRRLPYGHVMFDLENILDVLIKRREALRD